MKLDPHSAPTLHGTNYPAPHDGPCRDRMRVRLGLAAGLTQFGVNILHLPPGAWSSQRHWHTVEDEFIHVLAGEVVLVTDAGETPLSAGDSAGFPGGVADGHHLQNRSTQPAIVMEIGSDIPRDEAEYPDIDMRATSAGYVHKDGTPYPSKPT